MAERVPRAAAISPGAIEGAVGAIDRRFRDTPQIESDALSAALGMRLLLKVETLTPIRSFKGRGAQVFVARRVAARGREPLVCASAGNFGQGMAWACRAHGVELTVFAAENANELKLERMRALGADVRLAGRDFDAAKDAARAHADAAGVRWVEDGREPEVTVGAGTIGLELDRDPGPIDALLVPVGNGALIGGIGSWFRAARPATRVIGVVAEGAPAMAASWERGEAVSTAAADTVADGIGVRVPVPEALPLLGAVVDEMVRVPDARILEAMRRLHRDVGLVVEPAGAAGVAAALELRERFAAARVATPLCGGNLTPEQMRAWLGG